MNTNPNCPFCRIASHQLEATIYFEDDELLAFQDTRPVAPVHVLVIPKKHISSLNEAEESDAQLLGKLVMVGKQMAVRFKVDQSGYRLVFNTGAHAGQSVFHVHLHMIGGRHLPFRFE
jgi:histidine triad (HIT) family protein